MNKKFIQSIENSYHDDYYTNDSNVVVYALLNVTSTNIEHSNVKENEKSFLKISKFLMQQLNIFEMNSKVILNSIPLNVQALLSNSSKRRLKLTTSYKNVIYILIFLIKGTFFTDQRLKNYFILLNGHNIILYHY